MRDFERELRIKVKKLEEKEKELDLVIDRKVDEEKKKFREEFNAQISVKETQSSSMQKQIDELKKKSEQISSQTRGEALEYELENLLKANFPIDDIKPIKSGVKGADIIQIVKDKDNCCGTILWESKNTAKWNDGWIEKLKQDQRNQKADIAVIASIALPERIQYFEKFKDEDAWITCFPAACCLATVLRFSLITIATQKLTQIDKDEKMGSLYKYFASPLFKQRIEPIIEALDAMHQELSRERKAMEKIWAEREQQIGKAVKGASGFYGDVSGIIGGASLPQIEGLQLLPPAKVQNK